MATLASWSSAGYQTKQGRRIKPIIPSPWLTSSHTWQLFWYMGTEGGRGKFSYQTFLTLFFLTNPRPPTFGSLSPMLVDNFFLFACIEIFIAASYRFM